MNVVPADITIYTRHATGTVRGVVSDGDATHTITTSTAEFNLVLHCSCGSSWRPGNGVPPCAHMTAFVNLITTVPAQHGLARPSNETRTK